MIDAGTFLTVDLIEKKHLGGWIFPGLQKITESFLTGHDLKNFDLSIKKSAPQKLPKNSAEAMEEASKMMIRESLYSILKEFSPEHIILTGGQSELLLGFLPSYKSIELDQLYLHKALKLIAETVAQ